MSPKPVICVGSALWDIIASATAPMHDGADIAGSIHQQLGGVALNIAVALVQQGQPALLLTAIGKDPKGDALIAELTKIGVDCRYVTRIDDPTDSYLAIEHPNGDIFGAIADCASLEKAGDSILAPLNDGRLASATSPWDGVIIVDGNLPEQMMEALPSHPGLTSAQLSFIPASPGKAQRLRAALSCSSATLYINLGEAEILCQQKFSNSMAAVKPLFALGAARVVITDGPRTNCFATTRFCVDLTPANVKAISTTGAGDVFTAAHIVTEQRLGIIDHHAATKTLSAANNAATKHITREIL